MTPILETLKNRLESGEKIPFLEVIIGILENAIAERDALKARLAEDKRLRKLEEATYGLQRATIEKAKGRIAELEYDLKSAIRKGNASTAHAVKKWQEAEAVVERCREAISHMEIIPDPRMDGATDCCAMAFEDVDEICAALSVCICCLGTGEEENGMVCMVCHGTGKSAPATGKKEG